MSNYMASKMAQKKAEGMLAPLLDSDDESSDAGSDASGDSDASSKMEKVKKSPMQKLKEFVVYIGLGVGVVASAGAMVIAPVIPIFVMGGVCIANVPYAFFKERQMGKIPSLRAMNNKLREDANNLGDAVDELAGEIDLLEPEADRAAAVEEELRAIADKQQVNVDKLVNLVKENEVILSKMRDNLRQRIVQDIITIVVKSDRDNDQQIDKSEAKTLALRIRISLQEYGVEFDTEKFLKAIGDNPSVPGVIEVVQKLLPAPKTKGEDDDSYDSDDSDSDSDEEQDEMFDMFYMSEDTVKGSLSKSTADGGVSLMTCDKKQKAKASTRMMKGMNTRKEKRGRR